jgi:purine nucleoside phosphorylase
LSIDYASVAVVANWAAGIGEGEISMNQIEATLQSGMENVKTLVVESVSLCD